MKTEKLISTRDIISTVIGTIGAVVIIDILTLLYNNSGDIGKINLNTIGHSLLNNILTIIFIFISIITFIKSKRLEKELIESRAINSGNEERFNNFLKENKVTFQANIKRDNELTDKIQDLRQDLKDAFRCVILKSKLPGRGLGWNIHDEAVNSKNYLDNNFGDAEREFLRNYKSKFF